MPFEPLDEAARFGGGEGGIERGRRMGAQVVLNQHDFLGSGDPSSPRIISIAGHAATEIQKTATLSTTLATRLRRTRADHAPSYAWRESHRNIVEVRRPKTSVADARKDLEIFRDMIALME